MSLKQLKYIQNISKLQGFSSAIKNNTLLIQYIDQSLSLNEREHRFNSIINECDYFNLKVKFLTHYDCEDPKDQEMLPGESLLEVNI